MATVAQSKDRALGGAALLIVVMLSMVAAASRPVLAQTGDVIPTAADTPIRVDQFGYQPWMDKVAVIVDPVEGFNADVEFEPGATIEVRSTADGEVVFSAAPVPRDGGGVDPQSGDRGWWVDFTELRTPGTYQVVDVASGVASHPFLISEDVYNDVLDTAMRVFWFNRGNVAHQAPWAGDWVQEATIDGPGQDSEARWVDDPRPDTARDLSGGWYDAGDTNKYVTFATTPVHQLLAAYELTPELFDDQAGIPESGNGVPDLLDEVRVELEWVERMQSDDGGVLVKVGFTGYDYSGPIEDDVRPRFYEEECSSSTIAAASMYAHGALVFADVDATFADRLADRAVRAWDWYGSHPRSAACDPQIINAGDADRSLAAQDNDAVTAATYLFALTGEPAYEAQIQLLVGQTEAFVDIVWGRYETALADALAYYAELPQADAGIVGQIEGRAAAISTESPVNGFSRPEFNLYRSYIPDPQYHWGSNQVMANSGTANLALIRLEADPDRDAEFGRRAAAHLNTLHGVNPLGLVYLSNMGELGAEHSVDEIYHFWFDDGTAYDSVRDSEFGPAPGYVPGGPNSSYSGTRTPPQGQPPSKSYAEWNDGDNTVSPWEITEPAIYYQSAYVRLLAGVMALGNPNSAVPGPGDPPSDPSVPAPEPTAPEPNPTNPAPDPGAPQELVTQSGKSVDRIAGDSRITTAIALSALAFEQADAAVIARADDFPDALASAALAAEVGGPTLLTGSDVLDARVGEELLRLGVSSVYVIGGEGALSARVADDLGALDVNGGSVDVERIAGDGRAETAALVAERVVTLGGAVAEVILARSDSFADALAAGSIATSGRAPILLTNTDRLPDSTLAGLRRLLPQGGHITIVGGAAAVDEEVEQELSVDYDVTRLAGPTRLETAVRIAEVAENRAVEVEPILLASAVDFPDALAAGPAAHALGGMLLLTDGAFAGSSPARFMADRAGSIDTVHIVGGAAALPNALDRAVLDVIVAVPTVARQRSG